MAHKKALLLGSYGQTNLGDDILMFNYITYLQSRGIQELWVNASTTKYIPDAIKKAFPDLKIIKTYGSSLLDWLKILRRVDYVVYGGGTVYKELYSSTGRSRYSVISRLAVLNILTRLLGTKIFHLHIGIGSLKTGLGRLITRLALWPSTHIIFRDQTSYDVALGELHLPAEKICASTDGLFLNTSWRQPWHVDVLKIPAKASNQTIVGVNVLSDIPDWIDRQQYIKTLHESLHALLKQNTFIVFLPFQYAFNPHSDREFLHKEILPALQDSKNYLVIEEPQLDTIQGYLSQVDVFIGMRFHSLLLSTVLRKPFLGIAYDTKCWRFIEESRYPHALRLEDFTTDKFLSAYRDLMQNRPDASRLLEEIAEENFKKVGSCHIKLES